MTKAKEKCTETIINRTGWHSHRCNRDAHRKYKGKSYCKEHYPPNVDKAKTSREEKINKAMSRMEESANIIALLRMENKKLHEALNKLEAKVKEKKNG